MNAEDVKKFAKTQGADLVGIASMDRFEGAPLQMDPRQIFPDAKSMIVFACRIPRGSLVGIEEGTFFASYSMMGYGGINFVRMPMVLWGVTNFIEDEGYDALPIANNFPWAGQSNDDGTVRGESWSRPVAPGKAAPDVTLHLRIAAFAAGPGQIGWSKVFLTPEFGPRQRFGAILTSAPLEPDPIFTGKICDRCMLCAKACSAKAISTTESIKIKVAGHDVEWGKLDTAKCRTAFHGGVAEANPFVMDQPTKIMWHGEALEGARGCIRECMVHLENKDVLKNKFKDKFRKKKAWSMPPDWKKDIPPNAPRLDPVTGITEYPK